MIGRKALTVPGKAKFVPARPFRPKPTSAPMRWQFPNRSEYRAAVSMWGRQALNPEDV